MSKMSWWEKINLSKSSLQIKTQDNAALLNRMKYFKHNARNAAAQQKCRRLLQLLALIFCVEKVLFLVYEKLENKTLTTKYWLS